MKLLSIITILTTLIRINARQNDVKYGQQYSPGTETRIRTSTTSRPVLAFAFPDGGGTGSSFPPIISQLTSGLITYFGLVGFFDRPCGKLLVDPSCIEARQSQVDGAGLGLYATSSMPEGTILGTYPGVVRPTNKYMEKYNNKPDAGVYAWRFTDNQSFIDPTDRDGKLGNFCLGGTDDFPGSYFLHETVLNAWQVPTLLARINEPPIGGGGCNVRSEENLEKREVVFSLSRDVYAGEELFMDYGLTYDRSGYS